LTEARRSRPGGSNGIGDIQHIIGTFTQAAEDLPDAVVKLHRLTRRIYRALHLTGYARVDFRVRPDGRVFALEANANPILSKCLSIGTTRA
jgi:D-alanine-D-alanine ligase